MPARTFSRNANNTGSLDRAKLKRLAIQIVGQLPADHNEAAQVLQFCNELVEKFLADSPTEFSTDNAVVPLRR
jgi:hypothetical protein